MKVNWKALLKTARAKGELVMKLADEHKAEILLATDIASGAVAILLTGIATPKALYLRDQRKVAEDETKLDTVIRDGIAMAPAYIPVAILEAVSIASAVGGYKVQNGQIRTLASGLALAEHMAMEYQDRVVDKIGEEANSGILESIVEDNQGDAPFDGYSVGKDGKILYFDLRTGHEFRSDDASILAAAGQVNSIVAKGEVGTVNDFYGYLPDTDYESTVGDQMTFSPYGKVQTMDIQFGHTLEPDGVIPKKLLFYNYNLERN